MVMFHKLQHRDPQAQSVLRTPALQNLQTLGHGILPIGASNPYSYMTNQRDYPCSCTVNPGVRSGASDCANTVIKLPIRYERNVEIAHSYNHVLFSANRLQAAVRGTPHQIDERTVHLSVCVDAP